MVDFGVLGPVEVNHAGRALRVGSGRERFVLAMLLLNADLLTSTDWLIDKLWNDPPRSARAQLHNMISNLRSRLGGPADGLIATRPLGYELYLGSHRLDLRQFRRLVAGGRQAAADGDHQLAAAMLDEGLSLWRGPALADVAEELVGGVRQALHEERLAAAEAKLNVWLALRRYDEVLDEVAGLAAEHPYREGLHQIQMLALVSAGRRADALAAYRRVHGRFVDDLGFEPGLALRELKQRILRGETPQQVTVPILPRQLPPVTAVLTGRDKLIGEVTRELSRAGERAGPVALLVGPGGVGKTTLAVAVAHGLGGTFPDGQLYADLRGSHEAPASPHIVLGRFLRALGVDRPQLPDDFDKRITMYRSRLAGSRTLVVLDDAASEAQVRSLLPGDGGCGALVTSRRQLDALIGTAHWTVPALEPPSALELFARIVGQDRVAAELEAATAIVGLCGQLPLAVCVAAARSAVRPDWTLSEFRARLAEERGRLDELTVGDLDVRANIGLSYRALSPPLRQLFRRLGLLVAPDWPGWVADELIGRPDAPIYQLVDVHLIEPLGRDAVGQIRFRLHDLIGEFALERALDEEPEQQRAGAVARLLSGWLALATEADERAGHGMIWAAGLAAPPPAPAGAGEPARTMPREWFEAERVSLTTAVDQACRSGDAELAGALALRLCGFLALRAYYDDWASALHAAAAQVRQRGPDQLMVRLLGALFAVTLQQSRSDELSAIAAEELALTRRLGDRARQVGALANAGWAARARGRLAEAADWLKQAVAMCDSQTPTRLASRALSGLALVYREAGQPARALPLVRQALAIERQQERTRITAICLINYAAALVDAGLLTDAEQAVAEVIDITSESGDDLASTDIDLVSAEIDIRRSRWRAAAERLDRSLRFLEARGNRAGAAEVLRALGDVAVGQGTPHSAVEPLRRSLAIWRQLDAPVELARVLARLDRALTAVGDDEAAAECRQEYRNILTDLKLDDACLRL